MRGNAGHLRLKRLREARAEPAEVSGKDRLPALNGTLREAPGTGGVDDRFGENDVAPVPGAQR